MHKTGDGDDNDDERLVQVEFNDLRCASKRAWRLDLREV